MPTSATGRPETRPARARRPASRAARGLSLIELLVVVAIIAVLSGVALLAIAGADAGRQAEREARRVLALLELGCERAELGGQVIGIHVATRQLGFSSGDGERWQVQLAGDLRRREFGADVVLDLAVDGRGIALESGLPAEPQALCTPAGELTPFTLGIGVGQGARRTLEAGGDTRVVLRDDAP